MKFEKTIKVEAEIDIDIVVNFLFEEIDDIIANNCGLTSAQKKIIDYDDVYRAVAEKMLEIVGKEG